MCKNCSALQITRHSSDEKQSWMDNGFGQKDKAEEFRREVMNAAVRRRGTLLMDVLEPIAAQPDKNGGLATGGLSQ